MGGKPAWVGIAPSPKVFEQLDPEEVSVLALLAWSTATKRPVTSLDVAALPDRNGKQLGLTEAKSITRTLMDLKIVSTLGMNNDRPLSVFLGGFQPAAARRPASGPYQGSPDRPVKRFEGRPSAAAPRGASARPQKSGQIVENKASGLPNLETTPKTPGFVAAEAQKLREAQAKVEGGRFQGDLVDAATERKRILEARVSLYERWLNLEPAHPVLPKVLARKRKALPELAYQLERARAKQAELEAEQAAEGRTGE